MKLTPEQQAARSAPSGKLAPRTRRQRRAAVVAQSNITPYDLMDAEEVAEAFGVKSSSVRVARANPEVYPTLAARLPEPLRRVGQSWVWLRSDVEAAVAE